MSIRELTDAAAVRRAMAEFDELGGPTFRAKHEFGASTKFYVQHENKLYDAKSIAGVAYGYQYPEKGTLPHHQFDGGDSGADPANPVLRELGFTIISSETHAPGDERAWRMAVWDNLVSRMDEHGLLTAGAVRDVGAYGGQQGIWVDSARTKKVYGAGVAVAFKHTGQHYPDEFNDNSALYHYPVTKRKGHDEAEIRAAKIAAELRLPIFTVSEIENYRKVRLGWVAGWDDEIKCFLVSFSGESPKRIIDRDQSEDVPFRLEGNRSHRRTRSVKIRPDQPRFKLEVIKRYGPRCPLIGTDVPEMIDGAHLRGDADGGSSHPMNGLPMNVALHRAFDAHLFAIHPETHEVHTVPGGPNLRRLGITVPRLRMTKMPHPEALKWRYDQWLSYNKISEREAVRPN